MHGGIYDVRGKTSQLTRPLSNSPRAASSVVAALSGRGGVGRGDSGAPLVLLLVECWSLREPVRAVRCVTAHRCHARRRTAAARHPSASRMAGHLHFFHNGGRGNGGLCGARLPAVAAAPVVEEVQVVRHP